MSSMKTIVADAKCQELHAVIKTASDKYLCYTRIEGNCFVLAASNGYDVWRTEIDWEELKTLADLSDLSTDKYLEKIRNGFLQADIQASLIGAKVNLVIGQGVKALTYELYEAKLAQKKSDLNSILFRLAERSLELESRLEKADMEIAGLRQQQKTSAVGDSSGLILDLDAKRNKQPKIQPKKPGMSAVNPASRKRRAAHGVQFD